MSKKNSGQILLLFLLICPLILGFTSKGSNPVNGKNIRVTDDGANINHSSLPQFENDSLNYLWNNPSIEMLIISPDDPNFINELIPLSDWKNNKGVKTVILSNYTSYDGIDNAERIRNMIKAYYEKNDIRWILIAGDTDIIPIRNVYNPDVVVVGGGESEYSNWDDEYKPTDFYYASLEGNWDNDGDGNYGESSQYNADGIDEIEWIPELYVGRFPASNALELELMVNKTLNYEINPLNSTWLNQMLLAGGISSYVPPEDESKLTQYIWQNYTITEMNFTHLIKSTGNFVPSLPPSPNIQDILNHNNFTNAINAENGHKGYSAIIIAGHGDPTIINDASGSTYFTNNDALTANNINKPFLFYADACSTSSYDQGDNSIGERLIKKEDAGAIGYIGGLRVTWYLDGDSDLEKLNRGNARLFCQQFFEEKKYQQGRALYDSKVEYLNSDYFARGDTSIELEWQRKNLLTYNLLGDPEVDIYTSKPHMVSGNIISEFYQGQFVNLTVYDIKDQVVPYARVHLYTSDGMYLTSYADNKGNAVFRLPSIPNKTFNITISGHNLKASYFNITTKKDISVPNINLNSRKPPSATIFDAIRFELEASDNQSGIESVHLLISSNNFESFNQYSKFNSFLENSSKFNFIVRGLEPGVYNYAVLARDYANNTKLIFDTSYQFYVEFPVSLIILMIISISLIGVVGLSILYYYRVHKRRMNLS